MLHLPAYPESLERKRYCYEEQLGIPVLGDGAFEGRKVAS